MAFSGNFLCTSFKQEILHAVHNFTTSTGDTFKLALYTNSASFTLRPQPTRHERVANSALTLQRVR